MTTGYDALNRPTLLRELGTTTLASYAYDDLSRRTTLTRGNSTTTSYGYDAQGVLGSLSHDLAGSTHDVSFTYARNQAAEIKTLSWSNDSYAWTGDHGSRAFASNGLNQYTSVAGVPLAYDGNGNLIDDGTWTYGYDADNRLRSASAIGVTAALGWDAAGRLRQLTVNGTSTQLLYDGERLVAEYNEAGTLLRRYVHGAGVDEPVVGYEGAGTASKQWYYADHLGSVIGSANAAGSSTALYRHGPFGELEPGTPPARFGYTGQQYLGALELYHYKARMYSPWLGRFLQTDPIGYDGGMNLYAYAGNNPINFIDPSGLIATDIARFVGGLGESMVTGGYGTQAAQAYAAGNYGEAVVNLAAAVIYGAVNVATLGSGTLAASAVGVAVRGGMSAVQLGRAGEAAVRAAVDIGPATRIVLNNGATRIPDGLNRVTSVLSEVKNVGSLSYTQQLRDFTQYSNQSLRFDLYVRPTTQLSPPLQQAIESGVINLRFIPGP